MRLPTPPPHMPAATSASTSASASFLPTADAVRGAVAALLLATSVVTTAPPALALDGAKIGACLFAKCPVPLARCVTDPTCAANLLCIQTCTADPANEGNCQIKCGDEFSNDVVGSFTKCAVTDAGCVPQRGDDGSWPVPKDSALVEKFSTEALEGDWYISAGLNKAFDTFDCQLHRFEAPTPTKLVGNLQWRIKDPIAGTNFVTRYTVQEFVQDPIQPGILYNHDNEFLHYQDDWYILGQKKDAYVVVYYRGSNDAWDGYGGAVIYSKSPVLEKKYFGEIDAALGKVGRSFSEFTLTDNSCRAAESKLEELEADLVFVESRVASGIVTAESSLVKTVENDIKAVARGAASVEKEVEKELRTVEREVEKDIKIVELGVEDEVKSLSKLFKK